MYAGTVHFTVSVWNRREHLELLAANMNALWEADKNICLHVCAFAGEDATAEELKAIVDHAHCPHEFIYRWDEFGNGLGHNTAAASINPNEMLVIIAVDVCLPQRLVRIVRNRIRGGETFMRPRLGAEDQHGYRIEGGGNGWGRGMLVLMKADYLRAGGLLPQRSAWCWYQKTPPEDNNITMALARMGLRCLTPYIQDAYCRWHLRDPRIHYYRTLRQNLGKWPKHIQDSVRLAETKDE